MSSTPRKRPRKRQSRPQGVTPVMMVAAVMGENPLAYAPGAIEAAQESAQRALVESTLLPIKFNQYFDQPEGDKWDMLARLGFVVDRSEVVTGLFYRATLPTGWKRLAMANSYGSMLVDEQGRKRATLFYKAAAYDREAFWSLDRRYGIIDYFLSYSLAKNSSSSNVGRQHHALVVDHAFLPKEGDTAYDQWVGKARQYRTTLQDLRAAAPKAVLYVPALPDNDSNYLPNSFIENPDTTAKRCESWLDEHLPNWRDPAAYWDVAGEVQTTPTQGKETTT
jgi:hypothetical protein